MSILSFLESLSPFLVSAARKTFDNLEDAVQEAGINGSLFAQIIKENVEATESDVNNLVKDKLKLNDDQLQALLGAIRAEYNIPTALSVTKFLQAKFYDATSDILHNSLANEVAAIVSIILSKGKLSWLTLLMGVGEYIYRKFVKGAPVVIMGGGDPPKCPPGYAWNGTKCVPDVG